MITTRLRKMTAVAGLSLALMAPATHAFAAGPQGPIDKAPVTTAHVPPRGPGDIVDHLPGGDPTPCNPKLASCDLSDRPHTPPPCNPKLASCDLSDRPHDPGKPGDPGDPGTPGDTGKPTTTPQPVDQAVPAQPTFTG